MQLATPATEVADWFTGASKQAGRRQKHWEGMHAAWRGVAHPYGALEGIRKAEQVQERLGRQKLLWYVGLTEVTDG